MIKAELLKNREVAQVTGLGKSTVRKYEASGLFPRHVKINGARRWRRQEVENWIASGCAPVSENGHAHQSDFHLLVDAVDGNGIIGRGR